MYIELVLAQIRKTNKRNGVLFFMKVLLISAYANKLLKFRYELIKNIIDRGHDLTIMGPEPSEDFVIEYNKLGCNYKQISIDRVNINPIKELLSLFKISKEIKAEKADLVLIYGIKLITTCAISAWLARVKSIFCVINGAGTLFTAKGIKSIIVKLMAFPIIAMALRLSKRTFFQNKDDAKEFLKLGLVRKDKVKIVNGSGVNMEVFAPMPMSKEHIFLLIGRVLRDKGIIEYIQAAKRVKRTYPRARFQLIGQFDINPSSIKIEDLQPFIEDGSIEYLGAINDVRPFLAKSFVYVLPSYREGTPRSVLEAMATGRPIITTDAPGCRETVIDGVNGFLVPTKNINILAEKMLWMIEHSEEAEKMGKESLRICKEKYDVKKVNESIIKEMNL